MCAYVKILPSFKNFYLNILFPEPADAFAPSIPSTKDFKCNGRVQTDNSYQQQEVEKVVHGLVQSDFNKVHSLYFILFFVGMSLLEKFGP